MLSSFIEASVDFSIARKPTLLLLTFGLLSSAEEKTLI